MDVRTSSWRRATGKHGLGPWGGMRVLSVGLPRLLPETNHYHLLMETLEANLSRGMRQLNGVYTL
jgi:hypothetical protein